MDNGIDEGRGDELELMVFSLLLSSTVSGFIGHAWDADVVDERGRDELVQRRGLGCFKCTSRQGKNETAVIDLFLRSTAHLCRE